MKTGFIIVILVCDNCVPDEAGMHASINWTKTMKKAKQAGTELGQAQLKLGLDCALQIWFLPIWTDRIGLIE